MAFKITKITHAKKYFYGCFKWTAWPLEAHYIGFILNLKRKLKNKEIVNIVNEFINKHKIFKIAQGKILIKKIQLFKDEGINYLKSVNKLETYKDAVKKIILNCWKTWDNYSISILYLKYMFYLKPTNLIPSSFFKRFFNILLNNISCNINKRNSVLNTSKKFKKLLKEYNFNNGLNREVKLKSFNDFKKNIIAERKDTITLSEKIKSNI